jgi:zinc and cadmium transporter
LGNQEFSVALTLTIYCSLTLLASLAGGWLPIVVRLTHRRMQIALSFVAGVMLGVGLLHLLPHGYFEIERAGGSIDQTMTCVLAGFLVMFFLQRLLHFHQHESAEEETTHVHEHVHDRRHDHAHDEPQSLAHQHTPAMTPGLEGPYAWVGAFCGLALHSLIDGVALAAGVEAESHGHDLIAWAGFGTFLAVALHKPFDALTIGTLMSASGLSPALRHVLNVLFGLITPIGALAFVYAKQHFAGSDHMFLGAALGFAAGTFLCIATSDLLPELHFHSHDRGKLSVALLAGIAVAYVIMLFESSGHEHHDHRQSEKTHVYDRDHPHDHDHD